MSLPRHHIELLAPAKTAEIGIEAVRHGADAVYIGGPAFGARATAGNDIRDLERLIKHAHRFGSRIFITLNTILRDDELEGARKLAWQLYDAGVDALIIASIDGSTQTFWTTANTVDQALADRVGDGRARERADEVERRRHEDRGARGERTGGHRGRDGVGR